MRTGSKLAGMVVLLGLAACGRGGQLESRGYGPSPTIPDRGKSLIPTLNPAPALADGWADGATPEAPSGFKVTIAAQGLDHPRWLYVLPNGDVLVAEANKQDHQFHGVQGLVMKSLEQRAGALTKSADRLTLIHDPAGGGAPRASVFLGGLHSPFGMALIGETLFIADTDAIVSVPYHSGDAQAAAAPRKLADLPANPPNDHWTRNLIASPDGRRLYVTVGSDSEAGEGGMAKEANRADILTLNPDGSDLKVYASGLRNPGGLAWEPASHILWVTVNERDLLGDDVPPDFMTGLKPGGFYGWPWSYFGGHVDARVKPPRPDMVAKAITPDYALGAHTAPLGMMFYTGRAFPATRRGGAFVAQHGSWNRTPRSGYKVIYIPFQQGRPSGPPRDFLTGFLDSRGQARGRPVDVVMDHSGALLVTDDVGNRVWRIAPVDAAASG